MTGEKRFLQTKQNKHLSVSGFLSLNALTGEKKFLQTKQNKHLSVSGFLSVNVLTGEKRLLQTKKNQIISDLAFLVLNGGGEEIRTLGRLLTVAGFQDQCIRPLCHPSAVERGVYYGFMGFSQYYFKKNHTFERLRADFSKTLILLGLKLTCITLLSG